MESLPSAVMLLSPRKRPWTILPSVRWKVSNAVYGVRSSTLQHTWARGTSLPSCSSFFFFMSYLRAIPWCCWGDICWYLYDGMCVLVARCLVPLTIFLRGHLFSFFPCVSFVVSSPVLLRWFSSLSFSKACVFWGFGLLFPALWSTAVSPQPVLSFFMSSLRPVASFFHHCLSWSIPIHSDVTLLSAYCCSSPSLCSSILISYYSSLQLTFPNLMSFSLLLLPTLCIQVVGALPSTYFNCSSSFPVLLCLIYEAVTCFSQHDTVSALSCTQKVSCLPHNRLSILPFVSHFLFSAPFILRFSYSTLLTSD